MLQFKKKKGPCYFNTYTLTTMWSSCWWTKDERWHEALNASFLQGASMARSGQQGAPSAYLPLIPLHNSLSHWGPAATLSSSPSNLRFLPPITTDTGRVGGCERGSGEEERGSVRGEDGEGRLQHPHPKQQNWKGAKLECQVTSWSKGFRGGSCRPWVVGGDGGEL